MIMKSYIPSRMKGELQFDDYGMTQFHFLVRHRENLEIGKNVEIGNFTVIGCEYGVEIEDDVKIGYHCVIASDDSISKDSGLVILKKGCMIGSNSVIMPCLVIGENSIIGANSFVNRSIPSNEVWAGTPVKFIKSLIEPCKRIKGCDSDV